ncbi:hypothetical protein EF847_00445 [Actinobacteria bacterium YIM 96077]|nr:hypothetical protein [Phytoactinopolyspora halophila]AYY11416.1 hypothetical protein EF847_00445 [Actinobacteria bacterium YIM 96077]
MGAVALVLTACSDDSDDTAASSSSDEQSPLEEYMGGMYSSGFGNRAVSSVGSEDREMSEEERQNFQRFEELVAECMQEEGFEYVPRSADDLESANSEFEEAFALEPEEFAEEYGYGFTTLMAGNEEEPADPNEEIREDMSETEREAYDRALWGDMTGTEEAVSEEGAEQTAPPEPPAPEDRGCQGQASAEVYEQSEGESVDMRDFDGLMSDVSALQERIRSDPRLEDAVSEWQHCMADGGYPDFEHPDDAEQSVLQRMNELYTASQEGEDGGSSGMMTNPFDELDQEELAEIQEYEVDVATVDYACQQEHYLETYREVAFEMEEEFVEQHKEELEQFRDEVVQRGGQG